MCLIALAYRAAPGIELLVAANRDEFFERPTAPASRWTDHPDVLAGRDLLAGGTWMGVTTSGRFAAITNFRTPGERRSDAPSRGALVGDFLFGAEPAEHYMHRIAEGAAAYNGFSLLVADHDQLWFGSNKDGEPYSVSPGIHGLSNHLLNEPWPKVRRSKDWLARLLERPFDAEEYFELLADETLASEADLPRTGLDPQRERKASAIRIRDPLYGTRCSTVLVLRDSGDAELHERSFRPDGEVAGTVSFSFRVAPANRPAASPSPRGESPLPRKSPPAR